MPIRALYETKEAPLPIAVEFYEKAFVPFDPCLLCDGCLCAECKTLHC